MDYRAIARTIIDIENQPHQWSNQDLAEFFVNAADEIERLRKTLERVSNVQPIRGNEGSTDIISLAKALLRIDRIARAALKEKE